MFRHKIIRSAAILTLANIITRLLGFFYRIFMSNVLGAEGMGLYQLISPVYMLVWAFSSAGLSTAISKLTAEQKATDGYGNMHRLVFAASAFSVFLASAASFFIYVNAPYICSYLLKDTRTVLSLRILAVCFPFMAAGSCIRGWFYGMQEAGVPAQCQVLEQCTRMAVVYVLSFSMLGKGLEAACAMAVTGMAAGEIISFIYVLLRAALRKHHLKSRPTISYKKTGLMLFALALPLTLNRVTGTLLSGAENLLIPAKLQLCGITRSEAVSVYGRLCGMAMPLIMFPSSLLTALATALMPAVSEASAAGHTRSLSSAVEKSLTFTSVIGIGTAGLFICLPYEMGEVIYKCRELGYLLRLLGAVCPFIYMQVTLSGILNGLGKQLYIFIANLLSSIFNIGFICMFVPSHGIEAYIFGWFVSILTTSAISLNIAAGCVNIRLYFNNMLLKPAAAIAIACMSLRFFVSQKDISLYSVHALTASVFFIGSTYMVLLLMLGVFSSQRRYKY